MKPYFPTESNTFVQSVKTTVPTGDLSPAIYLNAVQPYKLDCVSGEFSSQASGDLTVKIIRSGVEINVFSQTLDKATTFLVSDIGAWLRVNATNQLKAMSSDNPKTDIVVIDNQTDQDLTAILDFTY